MCCCAQGLIQEGAIGTIIHPQTHKSNFNHHDFVQFGKQHSRCKAILSSIVLSQQCCEVYLISLTVGNRYVIWLPNITEISPLIVMAGSSPGCACLRVTNQSRWFSIEATLLLHFHERCMLSVWIFKKASAVFWIAVWVKHKRGSILNSCKFLLCNFRIMFILEPGKK